MFAKFNYLILALVFIISCSRDVPTTLELSNPGFGITQTTIDARPEGVDVPVLIKTNDVIKGLQFTLSWNPELGQVIKPSLTDANPGFTISAGEAVNGEMKILIFSMQGEAFDTKEQVIMNIPIRIIDPDADLFTLTFRNTIFAGPGAISYEIPVTHARLKINR